MQVRHQKPFKCLYYLIIWWFGDHLIICSSSGNLVIIWLSGDHQELLLNGVDCMIVSHSLRSLSGGSDRQLLSIVIIWWSSGDHLVIIDCMPLPAQPQRSLRRRRARTERPRSASPLQVACRCRCHHHHHHHHHHRPHHLVIITIIIRTWRRPHQLGGGHVAGEVGQSNIN